MSGLMAIWLFLTRLFQILSDVCAKGKKSLWLERPQRHVPAAGPIDGFRDGTVERWNGTRQNHGMAGNREAGGFVNSAVSLSGSNVKTGKYMYHLQITS